MAKATKIPVDTYCIVPWFLSRKSVKGSSSSKENECTHSIDPEFCVGERKIEKFRFFFLVRSRLGLMYE